MHIIRMKTWCFFFWCHLTQSHVVLPFFDFLKTFKSNWQNNKITPIWKIFKLCICYFKTKTLIFKPTINFPFIRINNCSCQNNRVIRVFVKINFFWFVYLFLFMCFEVFLVPLKLYQYATFKIFLFMFLNTYFCH